MGEDNGMMDPCSRVLRHDTYYFRIVLVLFWQAPPGAHLMVLAQLSFQGRWRDLARICLDG